MTRVSVRCLGVLEGVLQGEHLHVLLIPLCLRVTGLLGLGFREAFVPSLNAFRSDRFKVLQELDIMGLCGLVHLDRCLAVRPGLQDNACKPFAAEELPALHDNSLVFFFYERSHRLLVVLERLPPKLLGDKTEDVQGLAILGLRGCKIPGNSFAKLLDLVGIDALHIDCVAGHFNDFFSSAVRVVQHLVAGFGFPPLRRGSLLTEEVLYGFLPFAFFTIWIHDSKIEGVMSRTVRDM